MHASRRQFLKSSGALALGTTAPAFWQRVSHAAEGTDAQGARDTILVVIQLSGGNDGLNTVIPFRDPEYAKARPTLKQPADRVLKINDDLAFHPTLSGLAKLLEQSRLQIVQGVGYPNPNRSHFASMDIWHKATPKESELFGWLGKTTERMGTTATALHIGSGDLPLALVGSSARAITLGALSDYQLKVSAQGDDPAKRRLIENFAATGAPSKGRLTDLIRESARETYKSSERLRKFSQKYDTPVTYPSTQLGERLKLISQLIDGGVTERVYYATHNNFDTHSAQAALHGGLLQELGDALAAFQADLVHHGHQRRVLTMTFSEFGRRVDENGSLGTDHGAASQMFLIGENLQPGLVGKHPSLTDLDQGDLKFHTDFRSIYATVLDKWLGLPSAEILGEAYAPLPLLKDA